MPIARQVRDATARLRRDVAALRFAAPVTHVYNPLEYAWKSHREYLQRYGQGPKDKPATVAWTYPSQYTGTIEVRIEAESINQVITIWQQESPDNFHVLRP